MMYPFKFVRWVFSSLGLIICLSTNCLAVDTTSVEKALQELEIEYKAKSSLTLADSCISHINEHPSFVSTLITLDSLALLNNHLDFIQKVYPVLGGYFRKKQNFTLAHKYLATALEHCSEQNDSICLAKSHYEKGNAFRHQGVFDSSYFHLIESLKLFELLKDSSNTANNYWVLGLNWSEKNENLKAVENYNKALMMKSALGDSMAVSSLLNNMGLLYYKEKNYEKALETFKTSLNIKKRLNQTHSLASTLHNIGMIYEAIGEAGKAQDYYLQSLKYEMERGNLEGICTSYQYLGINAINMKDPSGISYLKKAVEIADSMKSNYHLYYAYENLSLGYATLGDFKKGLEFKTSAFEYYNSMMDESSNRAMAEMQTKYDSEKKDQEIKLQKEQITKQQLEKEIQEEKIRLANYQLVIAGVGLLALAIVVFVIMKSANERRKKNVLLQAKNREILIQKDQITEQKRELTDSIDYAKSIQSSILPDIEEIQAAVQDCFVLFLPRNIVSGDFYFFHQNNDEIYICVADCTGHGVPGAFVSMTGYSAFSKIIIDEGNSDPGKILTSVHNYILDVFMRKGAQENVTDGMDAALIKINLKNRGEIEFAGAKNPMFIAEGNEIVVVPASRRSLGGFTSRDFNFETQKVQVKSGGSVYLFSDGYADQFGGKTGKKYKYDTFKSKIIEIAQQPLFEQKDLLYEEFNTWKGDHFQVDDICVVGIRV